MLVSVSAMCVCAKRLYAPGLQEWMLGMACFKSIILLSIQCFPFVELCGAHLVSSTVPERRPYNRWNGLLGAKAKQYDAKEVQCRISVTS
jgi:hypothetical protein